MEKVLGRSKEQAARRSGGVCRIRREPASWWRAAPVTTAVAAGLLLASCGGANGSADATHSTTSDAKPTTTIASATTTTIAPAAAAVLKAYRAGWAAYGHALAGADPNDPQLAATMAGPLLQRTKANLLGYEQEGIVGRGAVDLHPKVVSLSATAATVVDCMYSSSALVYAKTGKPVPPVTSPENDGVRATLVNAGGTWKVSQQTVTEGKCAAGS
ncbi:MAG: hypothetical protein ACRDYB_16970 [Acidimicrobiales bacterium]